MDPLFFTSSYFSFAADTRHRIFFNRALENGSIYTDRKLECVIGSSKEQQKEEAKCV